MKSFFRSLVSEDSRVSAMRVMSILALITAIVIAIIGVCKPVVDYSGLSLLCSTFLGFAFAGKAVQKAIEKPSDKL